MIKDEFTPTWRDRLLDFLLIPIVIPLLWVSYKINRRYWSNKRTWGNYKVKDSIGDRGRSR